MFYTGMYGMGTGIYPQTLDEIVIIVVEVVVVFVAVADFVVKLKLQLTTNTPN